MNLFTSDIDWAPEEVIADTLDLFSKYNVKCTLFCTHESKVIKSIDNDENFELGIHPNFMPIFNGDNTSITKIIEDILKVVPKSKGVRSHSMVQSTPLLNIFKEYGLKYEANTLLPYWGEIHPTRLWNGLIKVPHNFEDDIHFMFNNSFKDCYLDLGINNLNIFCFHPIHVFLNTDAESTYLNAKKFYKDSKRLKKFKNNKEFGTRDLLVQLLENHSHYSEKNMTVFEFLTYNKYIEDGN